MSALADNSPWIRRVMIGLTVALVAVIGALSWLVRRMPREGDGREAYLSTSGPGGELAELWPVPAFSYLDQAGKPVTDRSFSGHVSIVDFIFTTCTNVCPMMTARMVLLERRMTDPTLRFVSFSVDPDHDTIEALAAYRARWRQDARWTLVHTDSTLARFARGMRVAAERQSDPANPILHSSTFFLVDGAGSVRGIYDSTDDAALERLARDASRLGATQKTLTNPVADGAAIYRALGCAGCHDRAQIAPPLAGIANRRVDLAQGGTVIGDTSYVRQSILEPSAQMVAGYQPLMPSYKSQLSAGELDALVEYLMGLTAPAASASVPSSSAAPGPAAPAGELGVVVKDPVCGMPVRTTAETPRATRDGHTLYFCSERCRDEFLRRNPRN